MYENRLIANHVDQEPLADMLFVCMARRATRSRQLRSCRPRRLPASPVPGFTLSPFVMLAGCGGGGGAGTPPPPPIVTGQPDMAAITAGGPNATGNLLSNDATTSGTLIVAAVATQGGAAGVVGQPLEGALGSLNVNADGTFSFAVANNAAVRKLVAGQAATEIFTYTPAAGVTTGAAQSITVTITGINDPPVAVSDQNSLNVAFASFVRASGSIRENDIDVDTEMGDLRISVIRVTDGDFGVLRFGPPLKGKYGELSIDESGQYLYEANSTKPAVGALRPGEALTESFTYTVTDGTSSSTSTLSITIGGLNDRPILGEDRFRTSEDAAGPLTGSVFANDFDPDHDTVLKVTGFHFGTPNGGGVVGAAQPGRFGMVTIGEDGTLTYVIDTVRLNALIKDSESAEFFFVTVTDDTGNSATSMLEVRIIGVDDPTIARDATLPDAREGGGATPFTKLFINDPALASTANFVFDIDSFLSVADVNGIAPVNSDPFRLIDVPGMFGTLKVGGGRERGNFNYVVDNADPDTIALKPGQVATEVFSYNIRVDDAPNVTGLIFQRVLGADDGAPVPGTPDITSIVAGANVPGLQLTDNPDLLINRAALSGMTSLLGGDDVFELQLATGAIVGTIDGGAGTDTFRIVDAAGMSFTPANLDISARLDNFERIDLSGTGNTTLELRVSDVLDATGPGDQLFVDGATGDRLDIDASWVQQADQTVGGILYRVYTAQGATLLIDADVAVV